MTNYKLSLPHQRFVFTGVGVILGLLSLLMPFWNVIDPPGFIGGFMECAAGLLIVDGFRRGDTGARRYTVSSRGTMLLMRRLLLSADLFQQKTTVAFVLLRC